MEFVLVFLLSCIVLFLLVFLPSVNSWALLFLLALLLSICIISVKTLFDRLSRIEHHLETLVSLKQNEENVTSPRAADAPPAAEKR